MISKKQLYAAEMPIGDSATRQCAGRFIYGSGGGGGQTQTTNYSIPDELKGAANSYSRIATQVADKPFQAYPGVGVPGLNNYQTTAIDKIAGLSGNTGLQDQTQSALSSMMAGGSNPYLDSMVQRAQDSVKSNMIGTMVGSGSFGNSGVQEAMGKAFGDTATQMYGNAYNTDQANKLSAIGLSPTVQQSAYTGANNLLKAGDAVYNNAQNQADFNYQQYQNEQNYPLMQLSALGGALNNMKGQTTTQRGGGK